MQTNSTSPSVIRVATFAVILGFLGFLGSDLYLPAMPAIKQSLHANTASVEFSVAIYMLGFALSPLIFGPLADRFGRRLVVLVGISLALFGSLLAAFSKTINGFLIMRLIQGFGAGVSLCIFRVMLRDIVQGKEMARLASLTTIAFNLSPLFGMLLGGYLVHFFSWRACFFVLAGIYFLFLTCYWKFCPETLSIPTPITPTIIIQNYAVLLKDKILMGCAICSGLAFSVIFAFPTAGSFVFQSQLHVSAVVFGWLGIILSLASIVGKLTNSKITLRFTLLQVMLIGMSIMIFSGLMLLISLPYTWLKIISLISLATGSTALILNNAMSLGMQHHGKHIGTAASLYGSVQTAVAFLANYCLSLFADFGILSLGLFYIAIGIFSVITWIKIKNQSESSQLVDANTIKIR